MKNRNVVIFEMIRFLLRCEGSYSYSKKLTILSRVAPQKVSWRSRTVQRGSTFDDERRVRDTKTVYWPSYLRWPCRTGNTPHGSGNESRWTTSGLVKVAGPVQVSCIVKPLLESNNHGESCAP